MHTPNTLLTEYAAAWLARRNGGLRPRSRIAYANALKQAVLPALGHMPIGAIRRSDARRMMQLVAEKGRSANTIRQARAVLSGIMATALEDELIAANPCARLGVDILKGAKRPVKRVPTPEQLELFLADLATWRPEKYPLFLSMAEGALRIGEAIALRGPDVDAQRMELRVERAVGQDGSVGPVKYGRSRFVPMTTRLARHLAPLAAERGDNWLFPGDPPNTPLSYSTMKQTLARCITHAKVPAFSTHTLRHACASSLASRGIPAQFIQRMLGHASVALTIGTYGSHFPLERPEKFDVA